MNFGILFLLVSIWGLTDSLQPPSNTGWGLIEVSPNAFLSLVYQTFRVSIYKKQHVDSNVTEYYYAPALILDPTSAKPTRNPFNKRFETTFEVIMYDAEFEKAVQEGLSAKLGERVPLHSIRILPIEQIRIDMIHREPNARYEINNQWTSYAYQPKRFSFRVTCLDEATCVTLSRDIADHPKLFAADLEVYFSLQTQRSRRRQIKVKVEHALSAPLYARLTQKFPHTDTVYMTSTELKKMTMEIASNVLASEMVDDDYVAGADQTFSIASFVSSLLQVKSTMSDAFTKEMWKSVFWNEDDARPDMITQQLNEVYEKSDSTTQEAMRSALNTSTSRLTDTASDSLSKSELSRATKTASANASADSHSTSSLSGGSVSGSGWGVSVSASGYHKSANAASKSSSNSASNAEKASNSSHDARSQSALDSQKAAYDTADARERLQTLLKEGRNVVQWDGRKFVPKAMELSRINLATFRSQTTGIATQVSVIRTTSELSSSINVLDGMAAQTPTQFCIGLTCLTVDDIQRVRELHNGKVSKITVAPDGQICLGLTCVTKEDFQRLLLQKTQVAVATGGQFCLGSTCLEAEDFQRVNNLPSRLETKAIAAPEDGQYCVGNSCMMAGDIRRLLNSPNEIGSRNITAVPDGQVCIGAICLKMQDFQWLLNQTHQVVPTVAVSGWIVNVATKKNESNVWLMIRLGANIRVGPIVKFISSLADGTYNVSLPAGSMYTIEVSKPGFVTTHVTLYVGFEKQQTKKAVISPILAAGETRIVLTWEKPENLYPVLTGPTISGNRFRLFYNDHGNAAQSPFATCEPFAGERFFGNGPPSMTIKKQLKGVYRYSVSGFSVSGSDAKVDVIRGSSVIQTFTVPHYEGNKQMWTVFEMEGDNIIPINTVKEDSQWLSV